ncbi:MAG: hypothetical protein GY863_00415 [bacterium]|nr:hypothetical protein [bacterium]
MFTDIVNYTSIMSKNEHLALEILQKKRDTLKSLVKQCNGEWLKDDGLKLLLPLWFKLIIID